MFIHNNIRPMRFAAMAVVALLLAAPVQAAKKSAANRKPVSSASGVVAEFKIKTLDGSQPSEAKTGSDAKVEFVLTDASSHQPIRGVHPVAWMSLHKPAIQSAQKDKEAACKEKIRGYLQGGLGFRPEVDMNNYFLVVLNDKPSVSVIDPLMGLGSSKLVTQVPLKAPGSDWVFSDDQSLLFVALPTVNEVAVIKVADWKVVANLAVGANPQRLLLQPDGKYLWVLGEQDGIAAKGDVTVIDRERLQVAARLQAGAGRHAAAVDESSRQVFVSNEGDGTLSIFDIDTLSRLQELKIGEQPVAMDYSRMSRELFIAHRNGKITVVHGSPWTVAANLEVASSLTNVRFTPDGRFAVAVDSKDNRVHAIDGATHRSFRSFDVGSAPDQIGFTQEFAYIRSAATSDVSLIRLASLAKSEPPAVAHFAAGQAAPMDSAQTALASAMAPTPEPGAMLVANPADKTIYYYAEGMMAPMGNFQAYGNEPRAVAVLDRTLKEHEPGHYTANVRVPAAGTYDVALLLDTPRHHQCFVAEVLPKVAKDNAGAARLSIDYLVEDKTLKVGQSKSIRFKLAGESSVGSVERAEDVLVQAVMAPGTWSQKITAKRVENGVYELELTPTKPGLYYLYVSSPSLGLRFADLPFLVLQAKSP